VSEGWSGKFCDPNRNGTKIISAFERNGSRIKLFGKTGRSDVNLAQLKWFK